MARSNASSHASPRPRNCKTANRKTNRKTANRKTAQKNWDDGLLPMWIRLAEYDMGMHPELRQSAMQRYAHLLDAQELDAQELDAQELDAQELDAQEHANDTEGYAR